MTVDELDERRRRRRRDPELTFAAVFAVSAFASGMAASAVLALAAIVGAAWLVERLVAAAGGWTSLTLYLAAAAFAVTLLGGLVALKRQP